MEQDGFSSTVLSAVLSSLADDGASDFEFLNLSAWNINSALFGECKLSVVTIP